MRERVGVASAHTVLAVSSRLWDFTRSEPGPDAPRTALPWAAAPFAKLVADLGATAVELDATIPESRFEEVVGAVKDHGLGIAALEALCPHPAELGRRMAAPGLVPLANPDESERRYAVRLHRRVIERASEVGAPVVVLTLGRVWLPDELRAAIDDPSATRRAASDALASGSLVDPRVPGERALRALLARRAQEAPRFLDGARFAIEELLGTADRLGRRLAIANVPALDGVPSFQELLGLLDDFRGAPIGAWLDVASIGMLAKSAVRRTESWAPLVASADGFRLRDVRAIDGRLEERIPGEGDLDLASILSGWKPRETSPRVLSLAAGFDLGRVREGLTHLRQGGWLS